jgi:hypothetical protein
MTWGGSGSRRGTCFAGDAGRYGARRQGPGVHGCKGELVPDDLIVALVKEHLEARPGHRRPVRRVSAHRAAGGGAGCDAPRAGAEGGRSPPLRGAGRRAGQADQRTALLSGGAGLQRLLRPAEGGGKVRCDRFGAGPPGRRCPETVERRLEVYHEQTAPLVSYYDAAPSRVMRIQGDGAMEEVREEVRKALHESWGRGRTFPVVIELKSGAEIEADGGVGGDHPRPLPGAGAPGGGRGDDARARHLRRGLHPLPRARCRSSRGSTGFPARSAPRSTTRWSTGSRAPRGSSPRATSSRWTWGCGSRGGAAIRPGPSGREVGARGPAPPRGDEGSAGAGSGCRGAGKPRGGPGCRGGAGGGGNGVPHHPGPGGPRDRTGAPRGPAGPEPGQPGEGPLLREGMVLAIEPMIADGNLEDPHPGGPLDDGHGRRLAVGPFRAHGGGDGPRAAHPHRARPSALETGS